MQISINDLATELLRRVAKLSGTARIVVGVAGPPGVGKSTLCDQLNGLLNGKLPDIAAIFPMDGYHFDDNYLNQKGWRAQKGAPHTFDVGGFIHTLKRLKTNLEAFVAVPVFDREIEISRAGARVIPQEVRIILVEGNYLLLEQTPWDQVAGNFDLSVMLKAEPSEIERRLGARWGGYGLSPAEILEKLEVNDLPNVRNVMQNSAVPDYEIWTDRDPI